MDIHWRLIGSDGQEYGPYQPDELAAYALDGTITRESMVWTTGLDEWIQASQVEGLFPKEPVQSALLTGMVQAPRPAPWAQASQPSESEAPRPLDKGYDIVSWGLRLMFWGVVISFLGAAADTVMGEINEPRRDYAILTAAMCAGYLLMIIGISLCFQRPRDTKARIFLGLSLGLLVLPIVIPFVNLFAYVIYMVFFVIFGLMLVMLFFALYMRHVSVRMANRTLELSLRSFLRYLSAIIGLYLLVGVGIVVMLGGAVSGGEGGKFMVFGGLIFVSLALLVVAVLYLVVFFWFLGALQKVRQAIQWQRSIAKAKAIHHLAT